jgi:hypothetical protein
MSDGDDFQPQNNGCFNFAILLIVVGVLGFFLTGVIGGAILTP